MASGKAKALVSIARFLIAVGFGYAIYYYWDTLRRSDPTYYSMAAGVLGFVLLYFMLTQIKGGGD